jgi:CheY-like chemotaxis protein
MSYPMTIQPLIIEDEPEVKETYESYLDEIRRELPLQRPRFAFSYEEASQALAANRVYQLVILDLRLPENPGTPPPEDVSFGLDLLDQCRNRNKYPIPGMLVISGQLDRTQQTDLEDRVRSGFAYGRVLSKGNFLNLQRDITAAIQVVTRYLGIGLHVRDAGHRTFPVLSPRDRDLLRRSIMSEEGNIGVDLEWWSAEYMPATGDARQFQGWTNVLMGRFLREDEDTSLASFFKFSPIAGAGETARDARRIEQRLPHIHVIGSMSSGDRSLLITRNATGGNRRPISLQEFLRRPSEQVSEHLPIIARSVVDQTFALGDSSPDQVRIHSLLWPYHDLDRILDQLRQHLRGDYTDEAVEDVRRVHAALAENNQFLCVNSQPVRHGDLNTTNVALSVDEGGPTPFIFDASGSVGGLAVSDIAMLEVTAILHQEPGSTSTAYEECVPAYVDWVLPPDDTDKSCATDIGRNTLSFLTHLRRFAMDRASKPVYALAVFDQALRQLGGLPWSPNKIVVPSEAAALVVAVTRWLERVAPEVLCRDEPAIQQTSRDATP